MFVWWVWTLNSSCAKIFISRNIYYGQYWPQNIQYGHHARVFIANSIGMIFFKIFHKTCALFSDEHACKVLRLHIEWFYQKVYLKLFYDVAILSFFAYCNYRILTAIKEITRTRNNVLSSNFLHLVRIHEIYWISTVTINPSCALSVNSPITLVFSRYSGRNYWYFLNIRTNESS